MPRMARASSFFRYARNPRQLPRLVSDGHQRPSHRVMPAPSYDACRLSPQSASLFLVARRIRDSPFEKTSQSSRQLCSPDGIRWAPGAPLHL